MIFALAIGCNTPSAAEKWQAATLARTAEESLAACPDDARCRYEAVVRFADWPRCAEVAAPWGDECRFREAEALERAGEGAAALKVCASIQFEIGCATHVLGQQARREETLEGAIARWSDLVSHTQPKLAYSYWRAFWHRQSEVGAATPLEACPTPVCTRAGEKELEATVEQLAVPCSALDRTPPVWIPEGSQASIAVWTRALQRTCTPTPGHPRPPPPPLPSSPGVGRAG